MKQLVIIENQNVISASFSSINFDTERNRL